MLIRSRASQAQTIAFTGRVTCGAVAVLCLLAFPSVSLADETLGIATLTYTKLLEGSIPEYLAITVDSTGEGTYEGRKLTDPSSPRAFKLSSATTQRLFGLAAGLNNFDSVELESHKKVANLGRKTFVYEQGRRKNRVQFNYTLRRDAQELADLFEKIASVQQHIAALEYAIKYDHLNLPRELRRIQIDLDRRALADPELMVPALERIARNRRFLNIAQARARSLLERIQNND